jgi:hypothetical protein
MGRPPRLAVSLVLNQRRCRLVALSVNGAARPVILPGESRAALRISYRAARAPAFRART